MRRPTLLVFLIALCACDKPLESTSSCDALCNELVFTCAYAAFPDFDSCMQGCGYNAEQGADVEGQLTCIQSAACDTFTIVECEHEFGVD